MSARIFVVLNNVKEQIEIVKEYSVGFCQSSKRQFQESFFDGRWLRIDEETEEILHLESCCSV
jgi:hypothetical protein